MENNVTWNDAHHDSSYILTILSHIMPQFKDKHAST